MEGERGERREKRKGEGSFYLFGKTFNKLNSLEEKISNCSLKQSTGERKERSKELGAVRAVFEGGGGVKLTQKAHSEV